MVNIYVKHRKNNKLKMFLHHASGKSLRLELVRRVPSSLVFPIHKRSELSVTVAAISNNSLLPFS